MYIYIYICVCVCVCVRVCVLCMMYISMYLKHVKEKGVYC